MRRAPPSPIGLGDRIRSVRGDLSQPAFADRLGVEQKTISRYENEERSPDATFLLRLAREFKIDPGWLLTGEPRSAGVERTGGFGEDGGVVKSLHAPAIVAPSELEQEGFVLLPRFDVTASAGSGALVHSEQIVDFLAVKLDWLRRTLGVSPENLALISAIGDSMKPTIKEGDLLMLDRSADHVRDNAIYAIRINGALLVKRIQVLMSGGLRIISDNPVYPPEDVTARAVDDLSVVGRIIWHGGPL